MLIVVINPVAVAPIFVAVTNGMGAGERRSVLNRAVLIAFGVALFFLLAGRAMLSYLGVTMHAFAISGGVLLFLISWPILYASDRLIARMGEGKVGIITRVLGIIPAALAVQYVFNGITGYYHSLVSGR